MKRALIVFWGFTFLFQILTPVVGAERLLDEKVIIPGRASAAALLETKDNGVRVILKMTMMTGNQIYVYVMNIHEYSRYSALGKTEGYLEGEVTSSESLKEEITLGPRGNYYIVLDNRHSSATKIVQVVIEAKPGTFWSTMNIVFSLIFAVIAGIVLYTIGRAIIKSQRGKKATDVCPQCGSPNSQPHKYWCLAPRMKKKIQD